MRMNSGAMLNAYPDSLGGKLGNIVSLLQSSQFEDVFRSFYILPSVFDSDLDRGFSVISYDLNRTLATAQDIEQIKDQGLDLKLDFILNHLSVLSPQFQDVLRNGDQSLYEDFFINWNKFWDGCGEMTPAGYILPEEKYTRDMYFRKPGLPILMIRFPDGQKVPYWNTFYQETYFVPIDVQDLMRATGLQYGEALQLTKHINSQIQQKVAEYDLMGYESMRDTIEAFLENRRRYMGQMDLNIKSAKVWEYYEAVLTQLANYGASIVRLDAFAYAPKEPGKRNFMNDPETWDTLERVKRLADKHNLTLLPEIHASYSEKSYESLAERGYLTYDFFLPGLVIDALENRDGSTLAKWMRELKSKNIISVNMLGCHDGIPLLDLKGLIPENRIEQLIELIVSRGGLIKNLHGQKDVYYQVNSTYFSALGEDERKMLLARALQLFTPGKPQIWYLDLFGGKNDHQAVERAGAAGHKEINRTNLSEAQIEAALQTSLVHNQLTMLRMYNRCKAFDFDAFMNIDMPTKDRLNVSYEKGDDKATLSCDLTRSSFAIETSHAGQVERFIQE